MKDIVNVFIYRRDFRVVDNMALNMLQKAYPEQQVLPIFIFNPAQIHKEQNPYFSAPAVEFMIESLNDLNACCKNNLNCFYGDDIDILSKILKSVAVNAVAFNTDFTPFAKRRDDSIIKWCQDKNIPTITYNDYVLYDFKIKTESGGYYTVFTPFFKKCLANIKDVPQPTKDFKGRFFDGKIPNRLKSINKFIDGVTPQREIKGGRSEALSILHNIKHKVFQKYDKERDYPALDKTTKLSAYLKFGCISIREAFWESMRAYGEGHGLPRELIWREFFANVTNAYPHVLEGQLTKDHKNIPLKHKEGDWSYDQSSFKKWCEGKTGFPFVDAAMICMNKTGFMHNRLRMLVAMFLTKDMGIDWKLGERYFAQHLVDYDPSSNSGGWQGMAIESPNFRILNPWVQSEKFDKDAVFIKKWIPLLSNVPAKAIHNWWREHVNYNKGYPVPMLDHKESISGL